MREEPVVAHGHAKSADHEHPKEKRDLKPVETEMVEVKRDSGQREHDGPEQEQTGGPVDPVDRETPNRASHLFRGKMEIQLGPEKQDQERAQDGKDNAR